MSDISTKTTSTPVTTTTDSATSEMKEVLQAIYDTLYPIEFAAQQEKKRRTFATALYIAVTFMGIFAVFMATLEATKVDQPIWQMLVYLGVRPWNSTSVFFTQVHLWNFLGLCFLGVQRFLRHREFGKHHASSRFFTNLARLVVWATRAGLYSPKTAMQRFEKLIRREGTGGALTEMALPNTRKVGEIPPNIVFLKDDDGYSPLDYELLLKMVTSAEKNQSSFVRKLWRQEVMFLTAIAVAGAISATSFIVNMTQLFFIVSLIDSDLYLFMKGLRLKEFRQSHRQAEVELGILRVQLRQNKAKLTQDPVALKKMFRRFLDILEDEFRAWSGTMEKVSIHHTDEQLAGRQAALNGEDPVNTGEQSNKD